ncbi:MAG: hypothetical protein GY757_42945 [bacterium]|nr:hypothetical protein [bacterium]
MSSKAVVLFIRGRSPSLKQETGNPYQKEIVINIQPTPRGSKAYKKYLNHDFRD